MSGRDEKRREQEQLMEQLLRQKKELFRQALPEKTVAAFSVREFEVLTRDGIKLKTICYIPEGAGPFPTVLTRSCYPEQQAFFMLQGEEYSTRGFAFVYQWCRGTGGSEGEWEPNIHERQDGLDTLRWLTLQDFSGNIGYMGDSYLALTGWCMADAVPAQVKSMYLGVYGTDRFVSAYKDGLFRQDILTAWAMGNAGVPIEADIIESYRHRPQTRVDEKLWGVTLPWYRDWITATERSAPYWQQGFWKMLKDIPAKVKIPIYIREGWYDHHLGSALVTYQDLSEAAREHSTLQIGPWNHGYAPVIRHQQTDNLMDDSVQAPLKWFYKTLVQEQLPEKAVHSYRIGADQWKRYESFPPSGSGSKAFYLSLSQFDLNKEGRKIYHLTGTPEEQRREVSYRYDPENTPFAHGAESLFCHREQVGSLEQPEPGCRDDMVSFVSEPLAESFSFCGSVQTRLFVSSDAEDTSFYVKVMEVFADGTAVNIRGAITTLAFRGGSDSRQEYRPGETVPLDLSMWDVDWHAQKGSRIRVDVSSSHFPEYALHSNRPGGWAEQTGSITAKQTLYTGGIFVACVRFPVMEE